MQLVEAACFSGLPDRMVVAFSGCLATFDRHPGRFPAEEIYWSYKWILGNLHSFPTITLNQINETFADAESRFEKSGFSLRPIHQKRARTLQIMGRLQEAEAVHRKWMKARRDGMSDCAACDLASQVNYRVSENRDGEALTLAEPLLSNRQRCRLQPDCTRYSVLLPLVRLGRATEAIPQYRKAARFLSRNRSLLDGFGSLLEFLGLTGNYPAGIRILQRHLCDATNHRDVYERFEFLLGVRLFLDRLGESRRNPLTLRLSKTFPRFRPDGKYPLPEVIDWCDQEISQIARQFDARNGTDAYARRAAEHRLLRRFSVVLPV
jgi:tetratricopeptide (TPR) repeat protein